MSDIEIRLARCSTLPACGHENRKDSKNFTKLF